MCSWVSGALQRCYHSDLLSKRPDSASNPSNMSTKDRDTVKKFFGLSDEDIERFVKEAAKGNEEKNMKETMYVSQVVLKNPR